MRISIFIIVFAFLFNIACEDSTEEPIKDYTSIDALTGLRLTDTNGQAIGLWRDPNDKPGNTSVFPNPNSGAVFVFSPEPIQTIWILNADCIHDEINEDIISLAESLSFDTTQINDIDIQQYPANGTNQLNLNLSDLTKGFYRLFLELDSGEINWHNIYIDQNATTFIDLSELDVICP